MTEFYFARPSYGRKGKRISAYEVVRDSDDSVVRRVTIRECGYWRFALRKAQTIAAELNTTND